MVTAGRRRCQTGIACRARLAPTGEHRRNSCQLLDVIFKKSVAQARVSPDAKFLASAFGGPPFPKSASRSDVLRALVRALDGKRSSDRATDLAGDAN
jgi:hypothetical protein